MTYYERKASYLLTFNNITERVQLYLMQKYTVLSWRQKAVHAKEQSQDMLEPIQTIIKNVHSMAIELRDCPKQNLLSRLAMIIMQQSQLLLSQANGFMDLELIYNNHFPPLTTVFDPNETI